MIIEFVMNAIIPCYLIMSKYLTSFVEAGHDSKEDAVACMRLMQKKAREILQKKRRKSSQ